MIGLAFRNNKFRERINQKLTKKFLCEVPTVAELAGISADDLIGPHFFSSGNVNHKYVHDLDTIRFATVQEGY